MSFFSFCSHRYLGLQFNLVMATFSPNKNNQTKKIPHRTKILQLQRKVTVPAVFCFIPNSFLLACTLHTQVLHLIQRAREIFLHLGRLWVFQTQPSVFKTAFEFLQTCILCDRRGSKSSVHQRKQKTVISASLACSLKGTSYFYFDSDFLPHPLPYPSYSFSFFSQFPIPNHILFHCHYF